jgi:hypothetical protein
MNSPLRVLALASQKGGSGKTTLAVHLAVALAAPGRSVVVVDTDPQRSATAWGQSRQAAQPELRRPGSAPRCAGCVPKAPVSPSSGRRQWSKVGRPRCARGWAAPPRLIPIDFDPRIRFLIGREDDMQTFNPQISGGFGR